MNSKGISAAARRHMARIKSCSVDGCDLPHLARGFCQNHYMQLRRRKSPLVAPIKRQTAQQYIESRSHKSGGCWLWMGTTRAGYGRATWRGKQRQAHALSWESVNGAVPPGLQINHLCHRRNCVNPGHLYAGTQVENMRDMKEAGRAKSYRGSENGNSKITEADVLLIRSSSERAKPLAGRLCVSESLIRAIRTRQVWRHVR